MKNERIILASRLSLALANCLPRKRAKVAVLRKLLSAIPPEAHCIDIGTGAGGIASQAKLGGRWTFIDMNENRLEVAKVLLCGEFHRGDAIQYLQQCPENKFRLITCLDTLEAFSDTREALSSMHRSLEPGGMLFIAGVENHDQDWLQNVRVKLGIHEDSGFHYKYTSNRLSPLLEECGFTLERQDFFCGFFSEVIQTVLDALNRTPHSDADKFTSELTEPISVLKLKLWQCRFLLPATLVAQAFDELFWRLPRYGFTLIARRK